MENDLSPSSIAKNLRTEFIGQRVIYYPRLTSTNDMARQQVRDGAGEGTVVVADEQTAGKGRIKRLWLTPKGNIALSIILYPEVQHLPYLVMLASLAVVHSIKAVTGLKSQIKWPNDVLISGKKVCGILTEIDVRGDTVGYAVIGIGINVKLKLSDFPEVSSTATSIVDELGSDVSRVQVIQCLLAEVERLYLSLKAGESIYEEWRDRLVTLGKRVQVRSGGSILEGVAESVAGDGSLLLRFPDGSSTRIIAGDVILRDAGRQE